MPAASRHEAVDEMLSVYTGIWANNDHDQPDTIWPTDKRRDYQDGTKPFVTITLTHENRAQSSLGNMSGKRRFRQSGVLSFQVSVPTDGTGKAQDLGDDLSDAIVFAYEKIKTPCGVKFFDVNGGELGRAGKWFTVDVTMRFEYDQIR